MRQPNRMVLFLLCCRQNERLRKENTALRWRLAMAGDKKQKNENEDSVDDLHLMLASKDAKIRILEEQVGGTRGRCVQLSFNAVTFPRKGPSRDEVLRKHVSMTASIAHAMGCPEMKTNTYQNDPVCLTCLCWQMVASAKAAGDEASSLRMRVMELEMGIEGPSQTHSEYG